MHDRRQILQQAGAMAASLAGVALLPRSACAAAALADRAAFRAGSVVAVLQAMGLAAPVDSNEVSLTGPDIAENGAVVPFTLSATAADVRLLLLLVEKNPGPLAAAFALTPELEPLIATRVKMGESSGVMAVAVTGDGRVLSTRKEVRVVLGGCGG